MPARPIMKRWMAVAGPYAAQAAPKATDAIRWPMAMAPMTTPMPLVRRSSGISGLISAMSTPSVAA